MNYTNTMPLQQQQQTVGGTNSNNRSCNNSSTCCSRSMTDKIHAEVKSMVANSRLVRQSTGIALVHRNQLDVGELLGRGAFSEVHEVTILNTEDSQKQKQTKQSTYAMKHLKARLQHQSENFRLAAAELAVEAHMLASFAHPNIMKIRGWAANGVASFIDGRHDSFFLLLDKLDETLDQRIITWQTTNQNRNHSGGNNHSTTSFAGNIVSDLWKKFSLSPVQEQQHHHPANMSSQQQEQNDQEDQILLEKLGICIEIASALAYLHVKAGVIFRDLKPNNIGFLNGRVQLFDFGLSRELPKLNLEQPFEMSGKVGTLRYMSPEVASHQVYNVSADVYSWSMVCYEIFVLEKPFAGWTRDMHANLVCGRGARPDTQNLPSTVRPILEACWNQYAYRRPPMVHVEQQMKHLEEQQLLHICSKSQQQQPQPHQQAQPHTMAHPHPHQQAPHTMAHQPHQHHNIHHPQSLQHHHHPAAAPATAPSHSIAVELPHDFGNNGGSGVLQHRKMPARNSSEAGYTAASTVSAVSMESLSDYLGYQ